MKTGKFECLLKPRSIPPNDPLPLRPHREDSDKLHPPPQKVRVAICQTVDVWGGWVPAL